MANKVVLNKRTNVEGRKPSTDIMEYGEIALNYHKDSESIFFKNDNDEIVEFKDNKYYQKIIEDNEFVTAQSLTQIKDNVGLGEDGSYMPKNSAKYISGATTIVNATEILDSTIQNVNDELSNNIQNVNDELSNNIQNVNDTLSESIADVEANVESLEKELIDVEEVITKSFDTVRTYVGISKNLTYEPLESSKYITNSKNISEAIQILDSELGDNINYINVSYSELVNFKNNSQLIPGTWYRITDYVTTTSQENTRSAGHQFDVLVLATDIDTLSEEAKAIQHEGDTYFDDSNLEAWKIWYSLDNDKSKFGWACNPTETLYTYECTYNDTDYILSRTSSMNSGDKTYYCWAPLDGSEILFFTEIENPTENCTLYDEYLTEIGTLIVTSETIEVGKGVIYRMIDERNNDCPYDFKNMQFIPWYLITSGSGSNTGSGYAMGDFNEEGVAISSDETTTEENSEELTELLEVSEIVYYYTFDLNSSSDYSLTFEKCYDNVIKEYVNNNGTRGLNGIIFKNAVESVGVFGNTFGVNCHNMEFGNNCYSNSFGMGCSSNSFGNGCYSNSFMDNCSSNSFGNSYFSNSFGIGCYSNTFGNYCHSNYIGTNSVSNLFGDNCSSNTFGDDFDYNSFGNSCNKNSFGNGCYSNSFMDNCSSNSFGNSYFSNSFGSNCSSNSFGNECQFNTFGNDCDYNIFGNSCNSNTFNGNKCCNNSFGNKCYNNSFGGNCSSNTFGNKCYNNSFGGNCSSNTFGNECYDNELPYGTNNSFGDYCRNNYIGVNSSYNSFGNSCFSNSFGANCHSNSFSNSCSSNTFSGSCHYNTFGNNCDYNSFGNDCQSNTFGNDCDYNSFKMSASQDGALRDYCYHNIFENGVGYVVLYNTSTASNSYKLQNVTVCQGMSGTSSNYSIVEIPTLNSNYQTKVAKNTNGDIKVYCEADLIQ